MAAFPDGQGPSSAVQPQFLSSLVVLATLPAVLMLALWKGGAELDAGSLLLRRKKQAAAAAAGKASSKSKGNTAVVVVDPYSSGGVLARLAHDEGYQVVRVLSCAAQRMADQSLPAACQGLPFAATIVESPTGGPDAVLAQLRELGLDFAGFLCGAEPGVELFDALTARWNALGAHPALPSNGEALSAARRDKYLMSERVRAAGLRAVRQARCAEWGEAEAFVKDLFPEGRGVAVILKPVRSSSSEDVVLARSLAKAHAAFQRIRAHENQYGERNDSVLVQEYMVGTEYVVNCVSRDGEHKVVSLWRYDKRPANGAPFVYHGVRLFESPDGRVEEALAAYIFGVLDALGVKHGPSHAEVMWLHSEDAPCLVEIGCRPHGGDGVHTELARRCIGYSQLDAMLGLLPHAKEEGGAVVPFDALPARQPRPLKAHAEVVMLVAYKTGRLIGYPGLARIRALPSFRDIALKVQPGETLHTTVDYMTNPGWVMLQHPDATQVAVDAAAIHAMATKEFGGLYALEAEGLEEEESEDGQTSEEGDSEATPPASP